MKIVKWNEYKRVLNNIGSLTLQYGKFLHLDFTVFLLFGDSQTWYSLYLS